MALTAPTEVRHIPGKRRYYRDIFEDKRAYGAISSAKSLLMLNHPFWGFMGLDLVLIEIPHELARGTLCTDGFHIFYSAKFINSLRQGEVQFAVAHEVYHCLYGHTGGEGKVNRMRAQDGWDPELANRAQDYFINLDLKKAGIGEFITTIDILYDPKFDGMSSEEIYMDLVENGDPMAQTETLDVHIEFEVVDEDNEAGGGGDEDGEGDGDSDGDGGDGKGEGDDQNGGSGSGSNPSSGNGKGKSSGGSSSDSNGDDADGEGDGLNEGQDGNAKKTIKIKITKKQAQQAKQNWEEVAQRAVAHVENSSQGAGSIPAHLRRLIADIHKPRIDWRAVLRKFTITIRKTGYSFTRPDKRTFGGGMTLPGYRRDDKKLTVAVAFDTSGSVGQEALNKFISEFLGIMKGFKSYEIHAFCFEGTVDHTTYKHIKSSGIADAEKDLQEYIQHVKGGGGTMFASVWDFLRLKRIKPRGLVFFTDGYPCDHEWETRDRAYCPTMFVTVGNNDGWKAPFGATVRYEDMG